MKIGNEQQSKTDYLDFVEGKFLECFLTKGYIQEKPINITSQIDPSIDFIGSKISPLKKYVLEGNLDETGIFLIQNSMKLKSLQYLKTQIPQMFGAYYKCMGTLTKPELERVVFDTFDYLTSCKYLNIPLEDISIRIYSKDTDLLQAIEVVDSRIRREVDTVDIEHYRHKYGLDREGITGRDFNIGIRKKGTDIFINCGTFVVMETPTKKIAIDMGIGNCSLSMCKFGTDSTVASSRMADLIEVDSVEKTKLVDSMIAVSTLLKEDIVNHPSKHFRKKFRQYCNALKFWNEKYQIDEEDLVNYMIKYLYAEYKEDFSEQRDSWSKVLRR